MAKQDIKEYVEGRLKTLLDRMWKEPIHRDEDYSKVEEVLRMAAHFQIKTRHILNNHSCGSIFTHKHEIT